MAEWMPGAVHSHLPANTNHTCASRARRDGIVLHTAASEATGAAHRTYWGRDPGAGASSTFYVDYDGTITQLMPLSERSWASASGNWRTCSVETQGQGSQAWTPAQVEALAAIIAWVSAQEGWPIRAMSSTSPSQRGVGWHCLAYGGESWNPASHDCPGSVRVSQIPAVIARALGGASAPTTTTTTPEEEEDMMIIIKSVNRPATLVGPGFCHTLRNSEELETALNILRPAVWDKINDRQFDVVRSIIVSGTLTADKTTSTLATMMGKLDKAVK